jgi:hypothetical protein
VTYLIRYGTMGHIARFRSASPSEGAFDRGQAVVIQSHRGIELGEVLIRFDEPGLPESFGRLEHAKSGDDARIEIAGEPRVLRAAGSEDLARAQEAGELKPARFARCQRILEEGGWPWELLDIEPLLDGQTTVLHYLGPRQIDDATMRARFRVASDFDVVFESAGGELESFESHDHDLDHACGSGCGSGGCGSGGGCGAATSSDTALATASSPTASAPISHRSEVGCASCGIGQLLAGRRR